MNTSLQRKILEKTYEAICTIKNMKSIKVDGETTTQETIVVENQPCALSHSSNNHAKQGSVHAEASQTVKLFLAPEIEVKPGSKITVVQHGRIYNLEASGLPAVYSTHQEINLIETGKA